MKDQRYTDTWFETFYILVQTLANVLSPSSIKPILRKYTIYPIPFKFIIKSEASTKFDSGKSARETNDRAEQNRQKGREQGQLSDRKTKQRER